MFHMDTNRLRQFCVIAETGSMTKAAELLHITHSGLSKAMKLLQEELGYALLRPSGRGLALTDDGIRIYQNAKEFLAREEQLFHAKPLPLKQTLRIGTVEIFLTVLCDQISRLPVDNRTFTLLDLNPGHIEQLIAERQLEYGITYAPYPMDNITIIKTGKYQSGCYHLQGTFEKMDISKIPFAVPASGLSNNPLGIKERDGWLESITPRNRKYAVNLLSTGIELTLQGLCAIYIPKFLANKINSSRTAGNKLIEHSIPGAQKNIQSVFLLKHKDQPEDRLFQEMRKMTQRLIQNL
jgi:DNA-binding transcriptional LysR family regulator